MRTIEFAGFIVSAVIAGFLFASIERYGDHEDGSRPGSNRNPWSFFLGGVFFALLAFILFALSLH